MTKRPEYILRLKCKDRPGIVAAVSSFLANHQCNILEAAQFDDLSSGDFFMRTVFEPLQGQALQEIEKNFQDIADRFQMSWRLRDAHIPRKVMLMVSKADHCLIDLLYRTRIGELNMDITAIVSNHSLDNYKTQDFFDAPFHHFPVTPETKGEQEEKLLDLIRETETELLILARYMQILSPKLPAQMKGRIINIHHSFLPGFKGAKPYHRAHERGVKLIGATAHYVTADLDEGPIIEQDVERVNHADNISTLINKGRDIERRVLAQAVRLHLEDRTILNGNKTVIF